ncbi:MAG: outer membrane beta-barrel protein [Chitinophagales bacterium]|nr:outer membrane beta-barrel protein [Chitinophagales bacterium]
MDKNMINIDDFMRQRLSGAEGQGQPDAAWLKMKDLLDQEMPSRRVPIGFNWKRMFGYIAGLVLLAAISVGGYQVLESTYSNGEVAANNPNNRPSSNAQYGVAGLVESQMPGAEAPAEADDANTAAVENTSVNTPVNTHNARPSNNNVVKSHTNIPTTPNVNTTNSNSNKQLNNNKIDAVVKSDAANAKAAQKADASRPQQQANPLNNTASGTIAASTSPSVNKDVVSGIEGAKNKLAEEINNTNKNASNKPANANQGGKGLPTAEVAQVEPTKEPAQNDDIIEKVPIKKIVRHETYTEDGKLKMDTIFNGKDELEIRKPRQEKGALAMAGTVEQNVTANTELMPQAAASSQAGEEAKMERLSDHRVKVKKAKKNKNYNPNRFEEMVQNTKYRMGQVKVYPGIVGGLNAAVSSKRVMGLQGGLACNISVSDRWSILTEAKYIHRFNSSSNNLQNDFITNINSKYVNNTKVYTYDSVEHYYNFSSYGSVEMPIALSYDVKHFNLFGGANLRYNFNIKNIAEIEQVHLKETSGVSSNNDFEARASGKRVLLSDFGSTFNVGYVFGVGYQATPAFRLDLRCTQPLWNNAKTSGQKELSRQLYNTPQLQFNVMYRFSSNRPYKKNQ